jgi:deoxyribodipyrimidine photo-lyase
MTDLAPDVRVRLANDRLVDSAADYVVYWMIAARRPSWNFALDRAIAWCRLLRKPLVVLEALRVDYPWASDRLHRFVLDGMADHSRAFARTPALYYPYVEPASGAGKGLLAELSHGAAVIVTDEFPCFFLPRMVAAAASRVGVRLEAVDSNGILPLAAAGRTFSAAAHYRRYVQKSLTSAWPAFPSNRPFAGAALPSIGSLPRNIVKTWKPANERLLTNRTAPMSALPIDHTVMLVRQRGGHRAARAALLRFVTRRLDRYHDTRNHPDDRGTSRLSPYLHFGHLSAHEVLDAVLRHERWSRRKLSGKATGAREGWWHVSPGAEAFLDQLVVWRELAYNACATRPDDYARYDSLPGWALATLADHESDPRPWLYGREALENGATHDAVWNAAQMEMRRTGWFHNYMRMLWGKKILEWSVTPEVALETMISLMNRWALDGRNPNSYAGYLWTLGRYDRPWPERPIYGKVRAMSSASAARKLRLSRYLQEYRP